MNLKKVIRTEDLVSFEVAEGVEVNISVKSTRTDDVETFEQIIISLERGSYGNERLTLSREMLCKMLPILERIARCPKHDGAPDGCGAVGHTAAATTGSLLTETCTRREH